MAVVPAVYFKLGKNTWKDAICTRRKEPVMTIWFWYAIVTAVLLGLHQVFTKTSEGTPRRAASLAPERQCQLSPISEVANSLSNTFRSRA